MERPTLGAACCFAPCPLDDWLRGAVQTPGSGVRMQGALSCRTGGDLRDRASWESVLVEGMWCCSPEWRSCTAWHVAVTNKVLAGASASPATPRSNTADRFSNGSGTAPAWSKSFQNRVPPFAGVASWRWENFEWRSGDDSLSCVGRRCWANQLVQWLPPNGQVHIGLRGCNYQAKWLKPSSWARKPGSGRKSSREHKKEIPT